MSIAITTSHSHPRTIQAPIDSATAYWDARAERFASQGAGLAAVCSYGMPWFYNRAIHLTQRVALHRWLRVAAGTRVLEIGCGVGRWSRQLARRGAIVTAVDVSRHMIVRARQSARRDGLEDRCRFVVGDACQPPIQGRFDLVFAVTVLQHILDPARFQTAVASLAEHVTGTGRIVLLEAAPTHPASHCNSPVFVARESQVYLDAFERVGLECVSMTGVDPAPFKTWFLPQYRTLPKLLAHAGLATVTVAGFLPDMILGRRWANRSWHKVFVLRPRGWQ